VPSRWQSWRAQRRPPDGTSVWTHALIAAEVGGTGASVSQAGRILAGLELAPHRVPVRLNRRDDNEFWAQAAFVCDIYLRPPRQATRLSASMKEPTPKARIANIPSGRQGRAGSPGGSPRTPRPSSPRHGSAVDGRYGSS
jgi:hypothetical protein